ncbi:MAG: DNA adenine methylase, partial [Lachnospirales bacterium]
MPKYPKVNYIGNKEKIANWIIDEMPIKKGKVLDVFSGGCSV